MFAPSFAKALIALIGAGATAANLVAHAHGWHNVDWVPVATPFITAIAVFAYPNGTPPTSTG